MIKDPQEVTNKVGLSINTQKTKIMTNNVQINNGTIDCSGRICIYLGQTLSMAELTQKTEIDQRITMGWAAYKIKTRVFNQYVLPTHICRGDLGTYKNNYRKTLSYTGR